MIAGAARNGGATGKVWRAGLLLQAERGPPADFLGCWSGTAPERPSGQTHQLLADPDRGALLHALAQREAVGREHDDGRAVLEPTHLVALAEDSVAGHHVRPAMLEAQQGIQDEHPA